MKPILTLSAACEGIAVAAMNRNVETSESFFMIPPTAETQTICAPEREVKRARAVDKAGA